jgi:hypothetical protein
MQRLSKRAATNKAFCASVAEGSPMSSGSLLGFGSGGKSLLGFWFLFFTFVFQSAAVPGRWNSNSTPAQSAIVGSNGATALKK